MPAGSAKQNEVDHHLELLDAADLADGWSTSADVEATKPEPDLVKVAVEKEGGGEAVMVGDSTSGCEAAGRTGLGPSRCSPASFSEAELKDDGAVAVYRSIDELRKSLDETPLCPTS